jgi:hypothetical protein
MLQMFSHQRGLSSGEPAVGESSVTSSSSILPTTDDLDEVLADSEHFIEELRASLPLERSMYFSPFKYVMSKISSSDSSNEKLASVYRSLLPKIDGVEAVLRTKVIELIQKKQVLQEQGRFLKTRLDSCIIFNGDMVNSNDHFIDELRDFVGRLSKECTVVNDILMFNTELIRQNLIQVTILCLLFSGSPRIIANQHFFLLLRQLITQKDVDLLTLHGLIRLDCLLRRSSSPTLIMQSSQTTSSA